MGGSPDGLPQPRGAVPSGRPEVLHEEHPRRPLRHLSGSERPHIRVVARPPVLRLRHAHPVQRERLRHRERGHPQLLRHLRQLRVQPQLPDLPRLPLPVLRQDGEQPVHERRRNGVFPLRGCIKSTTRARADRSGFCRGLRVEGRLVGVGDLRAHSRRRFRSQRRLRPRGDRDHRDAPVEDRGDRDHRRHGHDGQHGRGRSHRNARGEDVERIERRRPGPAARHRAVLFDQLQEPPAEGAATETEARGDGERGLEVERVAAAEGVQHRTHEPDADPLLSLVRGPACSAAATHARGGGPRRVGPRRRPPAPARARCESTGGRRKLVHRSRSDRPPRALGLDPWGFALLWGSAPRETTPSPARAERREGHAAGLPEAPTQRRRCRSRGARGSAAQRLRGSWRTRDGARPGTVRRPPAQ